MAYSVSASCLSVISCVLSILGAIVIFGTYRAIPEIRNTTRKLMVCLTAADFLTASSILLAVIRYFFILNSDPETSFCTIQSMITTFSSLVSFFLTVVIAVHIFTTLVYGRSNDLAFLVVANFVSWTIPGIIVGVAAKYEVLGGDDRETPDSLPWCWVKTCVEHHSVWMVITGKLWEILCYILTTSIYVLLKFYLYLRHRSERFSRIRTSLRDEDQNFLYVWLIFYVIRLWGTIRFFVFVANPDLPDDNIPTMLLLHMQAFGDPSQAFFNCVLFCFLDKTVRDYLFSKFRQSIIKARHLIENCAKDSIDGQWPEENGCSTSSLKGHEFGTSGNYRSTASSRV